MPPHTLPQAWAVGILLVFGIGWVLFGAWLGRRNRNLQDYMLAGRTVGLALATATAMATWVTSNTTMAAPQVTYQLGILGTVGYSLGAVGLLLFAPLAGRIKTLLPDGYTSGDFMRRRYGTTTWRVFLLISLFYAFGWLISLGMAGGLLINALSGLPYALGMTAILVICVGYTLLGGLRAVIVTDFVQVVIILMGLAILAWLVTRHISFEQVHSVINSERPQLLSLLFPAAIMFLFNNLLFGIGEIFHSNVWWSRAFAYADGVGVRAYLLAGLLWIPIPIVAGFIALAAPAMEVAVPSADMVGPMVAGALLGTAGAVLVFVVIFAALASSLDSVLAATADLLTQDFYRGHLRPRATDMELQRAGKITILLLGVATWLLCLPRMATLAALLHFTGAFVASTIWPIVLGLYYRRANGLFASLAMLLGTFAGLAAYFMVGFYVAALVSCATSAAVMLSGLWLKPGQFDFSVLARSDIRQQRS